MLYAYLHLIVLGNETFVQDIVLLSPWKHQRISLAWMLRREQENNARGGMLCDEQGLGKTITLISLIATRSLANVQVHPSQQLTLSSDMQVE